MGNKGQIGIVKDFLTNEGTDEMRGFIGQQDTIGAAGYDAKVHAFVRPNIVYQSNDINYVGTDEGFLGNPERVNVIDPIAYQTNANANTLDDVQIRRTTFYAQNEKK